MAEVYSVADLARRLNTMEVQVGSLATTQTLNHKQNRSDIHDLRNILQTLVDKVSHLEIKNARWNIVAGITTALALKLIDHLIKS